MADLSDSMHKVLQALEGRPATVGELAGSCGLSIRATILTLDGLRTVGGYDEECPIIEDVEYTEKPDLLRLYYPVLKGK